MPQKWMEVAVRNHTAGSFANHITIDGQQFLPHHVDPTTRLVKLRRQYSYQYSTASDEYVQEMKKANQQYETDMTHCKKLLNELNIALTNSQRKLAEDIESVCEKTCDTELSTLGAMLVEQRTITKEIKLQQERLAQLKPTPLDKSKFTIYEFHSDIELCLGWHQFNGITYELIHTPSKSESEISALLQPNRHPVSVKRTRQQFESDQSPNDDDNETD